ncbi:MAG TPA: hemerythrin domain-containing protein [Gammaproteobacteria bacterium]|nr:hemerythrin domain-containing protein [Gammaproteobacteria bacterium]
MPIPFFSRKPKSTPDSVAEPPPPLREVGYDSALVAALTREHRDMLLLLDKAKSAVQAQRYDDVQGNLDRLRIELANHIKRETDELHAYLTAHIKSVDRLANLKDMHAGMLRTERALEGFLKHYGGYPVTPRNAAVFYKEIDGVSAEFAKWTRQEETAVYSLYWPPERY